MVAAAPTYGTTILLELPLVHSVPRRGARAGPARGDDAQGGPNKGELFNREAKLAANLSRKVASLVGISMVRMWPWTFQLSPLDERSHQTLLFCIIVNHEDLCPSYRCLRGFRLRLRACRQGSPIHSAQWPFQDHL